MNHVIFLYFIKNYKHEKYLFKIHKVVQVRIVINKSYILQLQVEYVNSEALDIVANNFIEFNFEHLS